MCSGSTRRTMQLVVSLVVVVLIVPHILGDPGHYNDEFVIRVNGGIDAAKTVAANYGFKRFKRSYSMEDVFILTDHHAVPKRSRRSATTLTEQLARHPLVNYVHQEVELKRVKRRIVYDKERELSYRKYDDKSVFKRVDVSKSFKRGEIPNDMDFNDQYYHDQWYLNNYGQTGGTPGMDINVIPVWKKGITGAGVVVTVLDDGLDHRHEDLAPNYDSRASWDMNDDDDDPTPDYNIAGNDHGTHCGGEVAAVANNSICGVGVAYNAHIGGIRLLDGVVTDRLEADALLYQNQYIDIYSASWGPSDDGKTMEKPGHLAAHALEQGAREGRDGKGSIYVWATGNGGDNGDSCACDGYVSSIYSISIGSISNDGLSTYYSEMCPATMAVIFTGGSNVPPGINGYESPEVNVVTTGWNQECVLNFMGTSAAAPMAAGCLALVLEANNDVTWRDVQYIVARTARIPNSQEEGWTVNGYGYHVNPHFGFGMLDCGMMVQEAQTWRNVPEQVMENVTAKIQSEEIPEAGSRSFFLNVQDSIVRHLEHVLVNVALDADVRGKVTMDITSPFGTTSYILPERPNDRSDEGIDFTFLTVYNWGEGPNGQWRLTVNDVSGGNNHIVVRDWGLTFYGVRENLDSVYHPGRAHEPGTKELNKNMEKEAEASNTVDIKTLKEDQLRELLDQMVRTLPTSKVNKMLKKYLPDMDIRVPSRRAFSRNFDEETRIEERKRFLDDIMTLYNEE